MRRLTILLIVTIALFSMLACVFPDLVGPLAQPPADTAEDADLIQNALEVKNAPPTATPVPTVYPGG